MISHACIKEKFGEFHDDNIHMIREIIGSLAFNTRVSVASLRDGAVIRVSLVYPEKDLPVHWIDTVALHEMRQRCSMLDIYLLDVISHNKSQTLAYDMLNVNCVSVDEAKAQSLFHRRHSWILAESPVRAQRIQSTRLSRAQCAVVDAAVQCYTDTNETATAFQVMEWGGSTESQFQVAFGDVDVCRASTCMELLSGTCTRAMVYQSQLVLTLRTPPEPPAKRSWAHRLAKQMMLSSTYFRKAKFN
jgi:hypothetical protein